MAGQALGSSQQGIKKVFATGLTETATYDKEGLGAIRHEGQKVYKWVKYNNGASAVAAVAGNVVYYYGVGGDAVSGGYENSEVTMELADGYMGAGVLQAIIADASFGWIQIKGPATLTTSPSAGADGNALTHVGASDGTLDVAALVTDAIVAYATDISADKIVCEFPW
ncbi:hypothetical protein LCGC14_2101670 [marine sediment metagenome]|uniref:Uncharacterized protein n=1 Tax=marine sediment metagenome TaxID=412755 RepID=A0A0F9GMZ4_9ZZZZ